MSGAKPDQTGAETVRAYIAAQEGKSYDERIAFSEGVMCAAFFIGAWADSEDLSSEARRVLERLYQRIPSLRIKAGEPPKRIAG